MSTVSKLVVFYKISQEDFQKELADVMSRNEHGNRPKASLYKLSNPHCMGPVPDRAPKKEKKSLSSRPYSDWKPLRTRD